MTSIYTVFPALGGLLLLLFCVRHWQRSIVNRTELAKPSTTLGDVELPSYSMAIDIQPPPYSSDNNQVASEGPILQYPQPVLEQSHPRTMAVSSGSHPQARGSTLAVTN
ncbi:hypothetical protein BASA61_009862 [Batrachochytrium salamandrivorans]|nr:hypothetical protein BASA60_010757 [Batrachochytrium salamandrivorans]KAH6569600.1 hypothetical protein BASA62_004766 [Batrachochytrium salamandrivorans]KAH6580050.1 hypothetical protein BASA61_009862 [Batrachochytrium salamandrivorans]KAH9268847.1 hypothetical protein BASA83_009135 [Batrachochytrium salamandrivorans]